MANKARPNYFEDLVDEEMIRLVSGDDEDVFELLMQLEQDEQRPAILSIIDKNMGLYEKIISIMNGEYIPKADHISNVVEMLREYVKVGEVEKKKFGEVMTPIWLVEEMLDKLPKDVWNNPELKWLDPCNGCGIFPSVIVKRLMDGLAEWEPEEDKRYKHIVENMIYVCELQSKNMFLHLCAFDPEDIYLLNIFRGSFLSKEFDEHMKNEWGVESFDIVIGNPPYNQMIDLKFLQKSTDIYSNIIMFVHPSTWLFDEKLRQSAFNKARDSVKNNLKFIQLFNGNTVFGIGLFVPCSITYVDKTHSTEKHGIECQDNTRNVSVKYSSIWDINKFSDTNIYPSLKTKILKWCKENQSMQDILDKEQKGRYWVNVAQIRGHVHVSSNLSSNEMIKEDFYTFIQRDSAIDGAPLKSNSFGFMLKEEADNFLKYLKTDFARFCLSIYKNNQNLHRGELFAVPYLDYAKTWTDNELFKKFGFTDKEVEFIKKEVPKYYK